MENSFVITNRINEPIKGKTYRWSHKTQYFILSSDNEFQDFPEIKIYLDGYVIPRNNIFNDYKSTPQTQLIYLLYLKYGDRLTEYIKGIFCIVIISEKGINLFTDHFGLYKLFYYQKDQSFIISNSLKKVIDQGIKLIPDPASIGVQALLNKNIGGYTSFLNIYQTPPATRIEFTEKVSFLKYWECSQLLQLKSDSSINYNEFSSLIKQNFSNFHEYLKPQNHCITLTGGKDSRTGLAALLSLGIKPTGFTYGNDDSKDVVYAKLLAKRMNIQHHTFMPPCTQGWYHDAEDQITGFCNPEANIHRAHRLFAFNQTALRISKPSAYYAGYMAGEFLMGPYYDDLIFTSFLTGFWEKSTFTDIEKLFTSRFIKKNSIDKEEVYQRLKTLKTLDINLTKKERQFWSLFEIGIPHHGQDIFLAGKYFNYVYPFFIDIDFLELLFQSKYSFLYVNNQSRNLFERYRLFKLNLNIQHILSPEMDTIPFGKQGSYNTSEYLKGSLYWTILKSFRYLISDKKYPANYSYNQEFRSFLLSALDKLIEDKQNTLHSIFEVQKATEEIKSIENTTGEARMLKFSTIVSLYRQILLFDN